MATQQTLRFLQPDTSRDEEWQGLESLWRAIYARLTEAERAALGGVHVGALDTSDDAVPFAFTNEGEDRVNLTLEIKQFQLELNMVGWKEPQSAALKNWLQTTRGEDVVRSLGGYEVVAFSRTGHKKTPEHRAFFLAERIDELGSCPAETFDASWITQHMIRLKGSRKDVKPAFHVRRAWPRQQAAELGDQLIEELVREVRQLLPALREIWSQSRVS